jgi:tetratricopeptide (TPR) repeat protein
VQRLAVTLFLLAAATLRAAASQADCGQCHAAIVKEYLATPMARSSGVLNQAQFAPNLDRSEFTGPDGTVYRTVRDRDGFDLQFHNSEVAGAKRLTYVIGAGSVGRSYLYSAGAFLFQAPVAWYASTSRWDLSPGFERGGGINLIRPVEPSCLRCHATGVRPLSGTRNGYTEPAIIQGGVSCERCHGPAEEHLARMRGVVKRNGSGILNPAKLERPARDSICAQCHLVGAIRIARDSHATPYRPGQSLFASSAVLIWANGAQPLAANNHFEQLSRSACWRKSNGKLWCGTCHDPHTALEKPQQAAYYRARCLSCHGKDTAKCSAPLSLQAREGMNCIACHMQSKSLATVQHAAQTDHSIPRKPSPNALPGPSHASELIAFPGTSVSDRELGLAYAQQALERNDREFGLRALGLLESSLAKQPNDAAVADQLAQLYDRAGREPDACRLYTQVATGSNPPTGALTNAGICSAAAAKIDDAILLWRRAIAANPGEEPARSNLAIALARAGETAAARTLIEEGLTLNPASRRLRGILSRLQH